MNSQFKILDGVVRFWIEQEAIHIKTVERSGDPVELTKKQAIELGDALIKFAQEIEE